MKTTNKPEIPGPMPGEEEEDFSTQQEQPVPGYENQRSPEPSSAKPRESSGRYRLLTQHLINGQLLEAGTEIGTDTGYPYYDKPSNQMEGLDDGSRQKVNELHQGLYGRDAPWHDENQPRPPGAVTLDREAIDKQRKEEEGQEPVSMMQAHERGHEDFRGQKVRDPRLNAPPVMQRTGDTSMPMGPATPIQEGTEDARVRKPLEEQLPKS